ncbi:MAG: hypothetical protein QOF75_2909 [Gaiellaceae bacterium]|nr:hypothetical protein [Gaiellaceae bacterium]
MTHSKRRLIAPIAVLAAALVAAATAYASGRFHGSSSSPGAAGPLSATLVVSSTSGSGVHGPGGDHRGRGGDLAAAATYLGIAQADLLTSLQSGKTLAQVAGATNGKTVAGLIDALVAPEETELAAAVTAGRITQAQADQASAGLTAHVTAEVNGTEPARGSGGPGGHGRHGPGGDDFTAAATYLGVTETALATQLQAGKTLAQVADATSGKSAAGLVDALVAHETTELDAAVTAGQITQTQRDALVSTLKAPFTALANGTRPAHDGSHPPRNSTAPQGSTHI